MKKRRSWLAVAVATSLTTLSMSCATDTVVEYIVPDVVFPSFPNPDCAEYDEESDKVAVPLWWWVDLAEYKVDVDAVEQYLDALKKNETK